MIREEGSSRGYAAQPRACIHEVRSQVQLGGEPEPAATILSCHTPLDEWLVSSHGCRLPALRPASKTKDVRVGWSIYRSTPTFGPAPKFCYHGHRQCLGVVVAEERECYRLADGSAVKKVSEDKSWSWER